MKVQANVVQRLTRKQLRAVEQRLGIYLDNPKNPMRTMAQQFGVYDEDEQYVGDICTDREFFTEEDLVRAIMHLLRPQVG